MAEYHDKFAQLSHYAPNEVADDAEKQCRFIKGLYDGLQLQLMSNTYPNFQALVNRAIVIDNKHKEMEPRRGDFRDRPLEATLASVPTHSKAFSRGTRVHLINGTMLHTRSATSFSMSGSRTSSRVVSRHHVRGTPLLPP